VLFNHGLWPAAMAIWRQGPYGGQANPLVVRREDAVWVDGKLTANGLAPFRSPSWPEAPRAWAWSRRHVHGFNRWSWAEAEFVIDGVRERLPLDGLAVKYGDGAPKAKKAQMNSAGFHLLDRQNAPTRHPVEQRHGDLLQPGGDHRRVKVNKGSRRSEVLNHHSWVECGRVLVPELVKGQIEGGIAMGIGHALMEEMPLYEGGPGRATGTSTATACRWPPRGGVEADCGNPAAAVAERPVQGHRRGDDPGGRCHRQRRGPRHRQARRDLPSPLPHQGGPQWLTVRFN
jgi:CO/xanthine dehydrogenase Mo-binding subunit